MKIYIAFALLICLTSAHAQTTLSSAQKTKRSLKHNKEIQFGATYSILSLELKPDNLGFVVGEKTVRNQLFVHPSFRYLHHYNLKVDDGDLTIQVSPFLGLNVLGGAKAVDSSGYKDRHILYTGGLGCWVTTTIKKKYVLGLGLSGDYIRSAFVKSYGYLQQPPNLPRQWMLQDISSFYKPYNIQFGYVAKYLYKRFTFSAEAWINVNNLYNNNKINTTKIVIHEKHFGLCAGFLL